MCHFQRPRHFLTLIDAGLENAQRFLNPLHALRFRTITHMLLTKELLFHRA
jgi:glyoxylase-like metal-dependent hydrolase (beta-lactamase superfamily II)